VSDFFGYRFADRFSKGDCWAAPIVFGPRTLVRTWGTRPIPFGLEGGSRLLPW
jgi:hypothetical protein